MHLAHDLRHLLQCLRRGLDDHIHAIVKLVQLGVGDHTGHLDERVTAEIESGHLTVDPDQQVTHRDRLVPLL
ncbi:hypothetical protein GCM10023259_038060 [Thermocatellispora tengchongensis]